VTLRDYPLELRFLGRRSTRRRGGQRGCGPPPHKAARPGQGPRRPMGGAMAALLGPSFWLASSLGKIRSLV
jgi:hypothetical protein